MEDFYIGGAALTRPAGHPLPSDRRGAGGEGLNFPEIVDLALPAEGVFHTRRIFHRLVVKGDTK